MVVRWAHLVCVELALAGLTAAVCHLRPTSRGAVTLTSSDPTSAPHIDPNYLDTEYDRLVAARGLRWSRRVVMESEAFKPHSPKEYLPGVDVETDEQLAEAAGNIGTSIFHPVSTCAMGTSPFAKDASMWDSAFGAVVDSRLRVFGVDGLRVADASIMPQITSGNTNSPSIAIGEKAAELILSDNV